MKKTAYILTIMLALAGLGWAYYTYASYLPTYCRSIAETVFVDKTELFAIQPTTSEILSPLDLYSHKWESVDIHLRTFSQYKYTERYTVSLANKYFLISNPDQRDKDVQTFKTAVDTLVKTVCRQPNGYSKSSIYAPFIEEVNNIASSKADKKVALAYTDCCENTDVFSIYRPADRDALVHHLNKVKELLSSYGKPCRLHGLTIYILYKPENDRDNENFTLMSEFYKQLFEEAGATVYISPSIAIN